jgi:hypothetical protein
MAVTLRLALWNGNGLSAHCLELQTSFDMQKIDIALISETHITSRTVFRLPHYTVFHTIHRVDTALGGAAVIIRSSLRHNEHLRFQTNELQAIAVHLEGLSWQLTVSAVYCPLRHAPYSAPYAAFFPIHGSMVPGRRGLERQAHHIGSASYHAQMTHSPLSNSWMPLYLLQHRLTDLLADGPSQDF